MVNNQCIGIRPGFSSLPVHGIGIVVFAGKSDLGERLPFSAALSRCFRYHPMPLFRASIGSCAAVAVPKESLRSHALAGCRQQGAGTLALCSCEIEFFYFL